MNNFSTETSFSLNLNGSLSSSLILMNFAKKKTKKINCEVISRLVGAFNHVIYCTHDNSNYYHTAQTIMKISLKTQGTKLLHLDPLERVPLLTKTISFMEIEP